LVGRTDDKYVTANMAVVFTAWRGRTDDKYVTANMAVVFTAHAGDLAPV